MAQTGQYPLRALITGIALAAASSLLSAQQTPSALPPIRQVPTSERLWLATLDSDKGHDSLISQRSEGACGKQPDADAAVGALQTWRACRSRVFSPTRREIGKVYAEPRASSRVVASIFEEVTMEADEVTVTHTVVRASDPGVRIVWPDANEMNDYGLNVAGAQRRGSWVRLLAKIPVDGWLPLVNPQTGSGPHPMSVYADSIEGRVLNLTPLPARGPDGSRRLTQQWGQFFVLRVADGFVYFREEIPSDYDCGQPVVDPVPLPPTLRARIPDFFNADGTPRFGNAYTKGC